MTSIPFDSRSSSPFFPVGYPYPPQADSGQVPTYDGEKIDFAEVPALIWLPEFDTDHTKFYRLIQHLSDYLIAQGPSLYRDSPNSAACWDAYQGVIDSKEYDKAENTWGAPGSAPMRDYGFYHAVKQRLIEGKITQPLEFTLRDVSPKAIEDRLNAVIDVLGERAVREVASAMQQQAEAEGTPLNLDFTHNPGVYVGEGDATTVQTPSLVEAWMYTQLMALVKDKKLSEEFKESFIHRLVINAQAAHITTDRAGVQVQAIRPDMISCLSKGPITKDTDCDAIAVYDYITAADILTEMGHLFDEGSPKALLDTVRKLRGGAVMRYDPRSFWLRPQGATPSEFTEFRNERDEVTGYHPVDWTNHFYKSTYTDNQYTVSVMRQRLYFKLIRFRPMRAFINGKPATKQSYQQWKFRNYNSKLDIRYEPIEGKPKPGEFFINGKSVELYEATRLGHNTILGVKRCLTAPQDILNPKEVKFPVVIRTSLNRSVVELGRDIRRMWNILWNRIEEKLNLGGADSAILLDLAQLDGGKEGVTDLMWQAKRMGVVTYNSQKLQDKTNPQAQRHLSSVKLTDEGQSVNNMLALAGLLKMSYDSMIGVGGAVQGQAGAYDSSSKLSFLSNQQSAITAELYHEDALFDNEVLQRVAEMQRMINAADQYGEVEATMPGGSRYRQSMALSPLVRKQLRDAKPLVEMQNGQRLLQIREKIEALAMQALPSGGASGIREYIKLLFADNPYEAMQIFDSGLSELEKIQAQQGQAQAQSAQLKAQSEAEKVKVPIMVEQIRSQTQLQIAGQKSKDKQDTEQQRADEFDLSAQNKREEMMLQSALQKDQSMNQAALEPQDAPLTE